MENVMKPLMPSDVLGLPVPENDIDAAARQNPEAHTADTWNNEALIGSLNHLIRVLHDGQEMYRHASENVATDWLKGLFIGYSTQREQFATELSNLASGLGVMPDVGATVGEALHQVWVDLKTAVVGASGKDVDILAECERGEDATKEAYETELNKGLPAHIHNIVQSQYQGILLAHDKVREMRDALP